MKPYNPKRKTKIKVFIYKSINRYKILHFLKTRRQTKYIDRYNRQINMGVNDNVWRKIKKNMFSRNKKCKRCGSNKNLTVDHIIKIKDGGTSNYENLQVLCEECHKWKDKPKKDEKFKPFENLKNIYDL